MANVLFTTYCNRNCAYCFAKDKVDLGKDKGDPSKNISPEALEKIIAFYKKSMLPRFVILGGEPTLHPQFTKLLDRVLEESSFQSILVFTNGIMPDNVLAYLGGCTDKRLKIAMNLNAPNQYPPSQMEHIHHVFKTIGGMVGLGINIYRPGQDYNYLINEIETYGLVKHIRLGLTHPIAGTANRYAKQTDFPQIAEDIVSFAEKAFHKNISFSFDCGFEFCMFTLDQHRELLRFGIKFKSMCDPIVDIGPDLKVWRCFPLLNHTSEHLDSFEHRNDIIQYYNQKYRKIQRMGNRSDCPECRYRINGLCSGGCLARNLMSFNHA